MSSDKVLKTLNDNNWIAWSVDFQGLAQLKECWHAIVPTDDMITGIDEHGHPLYFVPHLLDSKAQGLLKRSVEPTLHPLLEFHATAREQWNALAGHFRLHMATCLKAIRDELNTLSKKKDESIEMYWYRAMNLARSISTVATAVPQYELVTLILDGLPSDYDATCEAILIGGT